MDWKAPARYQQPVEVTPQGDSFIRIRAELPFPWMCDACTVAWSILDRQRTAYRCLHDWLSLVLRFTLAAIMFLYGFDKAFPLQFHSITR